MNTCVQLASQSEVTVIPNTVIDQVLTEANELQLKVYLYILRHQADSDMLQIPRMADYFNETEKDIGRAVRFWENKGIFVLTQEQPAAQNAAGQPDDSAQPPAVPVRPKLSRDQIHQLSTDKEFSGLMFLSESFIGKPLTSRDLESLFFITKSLHFSNELLEYLLEYCASQNKKNFKYVEAVAIAWSSQGITTPQEAKEQNQAYNHRIYSVMNALGRRTDPTPAEIAYIQRWYQEYMMDTEVIEEACRRTVLATDKNRFQYADKILLSWSQAGVRSVPDIAKADSTYSRKRHAAPRRSAQPAYAANNPFLQHTQSDTDYDKLEKLLS
ncbi:MAG: DnaD domain protein [Lachnospiraceae bacterium]|nr:DnaD domain protein [Lachnospiraceae bacterium]